MQSTHLCTREKGIRSCCPALLHKGKNDRNIPNTSPFFFLRIRVRNNEELQNNRTE
jgi:hypothetical protein